jgi:hypothetical protein
MATKIGCHIVQFKQMEEIYVEMKFLKLKDFMHLFSTFIYLFSSSWSN